MERSQGPFPSPRRPGPTERTTMKVETRQTMLALCKAAITDEAERREVQDLFRERKPKDEMLTGRAAAELAGVTRRTLRTWERKGWVAGVHITPRRVRFSKSALLAFLGECETAEG